MKKFLIKHKYSLIIFVISVLIFFINYRPGTFLIGWDNLQTELSPWLGVKRAALSVWEEYQSFGLVAGMAHASDLPRAIFVWLVSFILPQNMTRYFFHTLMFMVGGLGMLKLLKSMRGGRDDRLNFVGALFYMLNLGTIQIFYVPFEPFSTFFAFLPWEIWIFLKLITNNDQFTIKDLLLFFSINLLATGQAYIQTLFVVYTVILGFITIGKLWETGGVWVIKKAALLFLFIFIINSFWIFPQIYFLKTGGSRIVESAKSNQLSTEDVYYQNKEKGTFVSFLRLEGFYFDLFDINHQALFAPWKSHFQNQIIGMTTYIFGIVSLLGILVGIRNKKYLGFLLIWVICAIALMSNTWPFSFINSGMRAIPIINQIFRSPFTKFIIPYSLVTSYCVIVCLEFIINKMERLKLLRITVFVFTIVLIVLISLPAFQGNFFASQTKVSIPRSYFEVMDYFRGVDKNQRVALLPDYTFWGWFFTKWGYDGSGFLWYGIEQPIVSRTFDVWSQRSESYFWQMKGAIESQDIKKFNDVLSKYQIKYLLVDQTLLPVTGATKGIQYDQLNTLLKNNQEVSLIEKWPELTVYQVNNDKYLNDWISISSNLSNIGPKTIITNEDMGFVENGNYLTDVTKPYNIYYPLSDFFSQKHLIDSNWKLQETDTNFVLDVTIPRSVENYNLYTPPLNTEYFVDGADEIKIIKENYTVKKQNNHLQITIPKQFVKSFSPENTEVLNCGQGGQNKIDKTTYSLDITSNNRTYGCFSYGDHSLPQQYGYILSIKSTFQQGRRLFFYVSDQTNRQTLIEDRLTSDNELYIIPPHYDYGLGYSFSFQNNSYYNSPSQNSLNALNLYALPYDALKHIKLVSNSYLPKSIYSQDFQAKKADYFTYSVLLNQDNQTVVLNQSYDSGWLAYKVNANNWVNRHFPFLFGQKINDHFLINNWANGWKVNGNGNIIIIFWPQYLEFFGFALLILSFLVILKLSNE